MDLINQYLQLNELERKREYSLLAKIDRENLLQTREIIKSVIKSQEDRIERLINYHSKTDLHFEMQKISDFATWLWVERSKMPSPYAVENSYNSPAKDSPGWANDFWQNGEKLIEARKRVEEIEFLLKNPACWTLSREQEEYVNQLKILAKQLKEAYLLLL